MDFERPARVLLSTREKKAVTNYCQERVELTHGLGKEELLHVAAKIFLVENVINTYFYWSLFYRLVSLKSEIF
jgi:hypothetical protein